MSRKGSFKGIYWRARRYHPCSLIHLSVGLSFDRCGHVMRTLLYRPFELQKCFKGHTHTKLLMDGIEIRILCSRIQPNMSTIFVH